MEKLLTVSKMREIDEWHIKEKISYSKKVEIINGMAFRQMCNGIQTYISAVTVENMQLRELMKKLITNEHVEKEIYDSWIKKAKELIGESDGECFNEE